MSAQLEKAQEYKYNSLRYVDLDELQPEAGDLLIEEPGAVILAKSEEGQVNLYWGSETEEQYISAMRKLFEKIQSDWGRLERKIFVEFVPPEFIGSLEKIGFVMDAEFVDFWVGDLKALQIERSNSLQIRYLTPAEYAKAAEITQACKDQSRGFHGEQEEFMKEWLETEHSCILAAEVDGEIAGVCLLNQYGFDSPKGSIAWLRELAVHPGYQGKGIGQALVAEALIWGQDLGAKRSFLAADVMNERAIRIYEKYGYCRKPERGQINMVYELS